MGMNKIPVIDLPTLASIHFARSHQSTRRPKPVKEYGGHRAKDGLTIGELVAEKYTKI